MQEKLLEMLTTSVENAKATQLNMHENYKDLDPDRHKRIAKVQSKYLLNKLSASLQEKARGQFTQLIDQGKCLSLQEILSLNSVFKQDYRSHIRNEFDKVDKETHAHKKTVCETNKFVNNLLQKFDHKPTRDFSSDEEDTSSNDNKEVKDKADEKSSPVVQKYGK